MKSVADNILKIMQSKGRGSVHTPRDFFNLGTRDAVDQSLSRLRKKGKIRRITQGIYDFPKINDKLGGQLSPNMNAVAKAIARKNRMRIMISGATAVNKIGLSTQVPAKTIYFTDGLSRKVLIGNSYLVFRRVTPKRMSISHKKSTVVLQALKYIGKDNVDDNIINRITDMLKDDDKQQIVNDVKKCSAWLIDAVNNIVDNQDG